MEILQKVVWDFNAIDNNLLQVCSQESVKLPSRLIVDTDRVAGVASMWLSTSIFGHRCIKDQLVSVDVNRILDVWY